MTTIYSIEGNIGSRKSTLIKIMKEIYKDNEYFYFLEEPVSEWGKIKDRKGETILSKFYANQQKYAFSFQMMAYISRISALKKAVKDHPEKIIMCERSVFTDRNVFAQMLYDSGNIEDVELEIYQKWFNEFIEEIPVSGVIYVKASPEVSYNRVIKRNRDGETIPLDYLQKCHEYHENWLDKTKDKLVLNANDHKEMSEDHYKDWLNQIEKFIS